MTPRVAVLGTGFGCRVHVPALRAAGFDVVALCGTDVERTARRAARAGVARVVTSIDELGALGLDAVTIATPPDTHARLAIAAAGAGWHTLCEKPFALDAAEAAAMLDAARAARIEHVVGHEFRLAEDRATITRAITAGLIGEPRLVGLTQAVPLVADPGAPLPAWWFDPGRGGGWLGASGSHVVDCVRVWTGVEFATVSARLPRISDRPDADADDTFVIRAVLTSGCEVAIAQTAAAWGAVPGTTFVAGPAGTLWTDAGRVLLADRAGTRELPVPPDVMLPASPPSDDPRHRFTHLELSPYTRLCAAWRARIAGLPPPEPVAIATFDDGLAGMQVLDAIRASAACGGAEMQVRR